MKRIPKQEYTREFREQAVAVVKDGRKVSEVARELGVATQTLRRMKTAAHGKLHEGTRDVTPEQMELSRLRAENVRLKLENEIPKKAMASFAKDAL